jgi:ribosome-associated protein
MQINSTADTINLLNTIIQGIQNKKGNEIVKINLSLLENSFCPFFIVCHGNSTKQVDAIVDSVEELVYEKLNQHIWHKEGVENAQWVLLDYGDVVVHIFLKESRDFYKLEELWADAEIDFIEEHVEKKEKIRNE